MNRFQKTIIFTKTPLSGYFLIPGRFQIYPANLEGLPTSVFQKHYPVILEYKIEDNEIIEPPEDYIGRKNSMTLVASKLSKIDEILNLLTLFANHYFFRYYDLTGNWGMPILNDNPGEEANEWSSKWNMASFGWPGLPEQLKIDKFTDLELEFNEVDFIPFREYYSKNPNYDYYSDKIITFPNNIFLGIEAYYSLDKEVKTIIDTAISHSVSAIEIMEFKKTLSVISAFTSIETMVNYENKDFKPIRCNECGQLQFKVAKKYRDYLLKYVGDNQNNRKKFNALYSLRSKIIHTGQKFKTENLWTNIPQEEKLEELINQIEVIGISKLSIINWMIKNDKRHIAAIAGR